MTQVKDKYICLFCLEPIRHLTIPVDYVAVQRVNDNNCPNGSHYAKFTKDIHWWWLLGNTDYIVGLTSNNIYPPNTGRPDRLSDALGVSIERLCVRIEGYK